MYSISGLPSTPPRPGQDSWGLSVIRWVSQKFLPFLPSFISVTYFVTYGTAMACYAYFVLTKQEYLFKEASDRQYLLNFYKRAQAREYTDAVGNIGFLRAVIRD